MSLHHRAPDSLAVDTRALYKFILHYIVLIESWHGLFLIIVIIIIIITIPCGPNFRGAEITSESDWNVIMSGRRSPSTKRIISLPFVMIIFKLTDLFCQLDQASSLSTHSVYDN